MSLVDLSVARRLSGLPRMLAGVSGGKDATACLALYRQYQPAGELVGFFWYMVEGLEFQERYLRYLERRFAFRILRVPHFFNSRYLATGAYAPSQRVKVVKQRDALQYLRNETGIDWVMLGQKKSDSPPRLWMLRKCLGCDEKQRIIYPLANWTHGQVFSFLKRQSITLPADYRGGHDMSFGGFVAKELEHIKRSYPNDWKKIEMRFPFVGAAIKRADIVAASKLRGGDNQQGED